LNSSWGSNPLPPSQCCSRMLCGYTNKLEGIVVYKEILSLALLFVFVGFFIYPFFECYQKAITTAKLKVPLKPLPMQ
jgi:hypothetical protein